MSMFPINEAVTTTFPRAWAAINADSPALTASACFIDKGGGGGGGGGAKAPVSLFVRE